MTFGLPKNLTGFVDTQREINPGSLENSSTMLLHYDDLLATVKAALMSPEDN